MTRAFTFYDKNRMYTRDLNSIYNYIKSTSPAFDASQLLRSEYALVISSFDRYIHDVVRERLLKMFFSNSLKPDNINLEISLYKVQELLNAPDQMRKESLLDTYIQQAVGASSFQSPKSVEYALSLIGINKIWTLLSSKLGMDAKDIRANLSLYINRRNKIVHEADLDIYTNTFTSMDLATVNACDAFINNLINAIEAII